MSAQDDGQPEDRAPVRWTDPRYADLAEWYEAARRAAPQRDGAPVPRAFLYELPEDRRPPTV
jgi:hypothetical protein